MKYRALKMRDKCPRAAAVILDQSIVDDNLFSAATKEELAKTAEELVEVFESMGLKCHKWLTNTPDAMPAGAIMAQGAKRVGADADERENPEQKALGLLWDAKPDVFTFNYRSREVWTTLSVMSAFLGVFDPHGFLAPFLLQAKLIYREVLKGAEKMPNGQPRWDQPIDERVCKQWEAWVAELKNLPAVSVKRSIKREQMKRLAVFSDASFEAVGAVAYAVLHSGETRFVAARSRVNRDPSASINRLELAGAVCALELAQKIWKVAKIMPEETRFFVDNAAVLHWIRSPAKDLGRFEARRVEMVRLGSIPSTWRFVDTERNPADIVSRGMSLSDLVASDLYRFGPDFLADEALEPDIGLPPADDEDPLQDWEAERMLALTALRPHAGKKNQGDVKARKAPTVQAFQAVSTWGRAVSAARGAQRAARSFLWPRAAAAAVLKAGAAPEALLFRLAQMDRFAPEMNLLEAGKSLPLKHPWAGFDVSVEGGVMMLAGRASGKDNLRPIMHGRMHCSELKARCIHEDKLGHTGGPMALWTRMQREVWTFRGLDMCRRLVRACVECKKNNPKRMEQKMAPLPTFRIAQGDTPEAPFKTTALDFAGPFLVSRGRGKAKEKRYLMMLTCAKFRAAHIEVCHGNTTSDVLMALQRFACRRGMPSRIISDNASEFKAAAKVLAAHKDLRPKDGAFQGSGVFQHWSDVEWQFYHGRAPHMGGLVERMVGAMKKALQGLINIHWDRLSDQDLLTASVLAEDMLNQRPLCRLSEDAKDEEPLTPAHFLYGGRVGNFGGKCGDLKSLGDKWRSLSEYRAKLWERFCQEFIVLQEQRRKWHKERESVEPGDVVIVMDHDLAPWGRYPLGRVISVKKSGDGLVRGVLVKVGRYELTRHLKSLCRLLGADESAEAEPAGRMLRTRVRSKDDAEEIGSMAALLYQ